MSRISHLRRASSGIVNMRSSARLLYLFGLLALTSPLGAQQPKPVIPHAQDKPPNDPRDPETAAKLMTVPEGFTVEVVAAEPDIVNPVAMAIDERGRVARIPSSRTGAGEGSRPDSGGYRWRWPDG
jgi:hypothetical protein